PNVKKNKNWKEFNAQELAAINAKREEVKAKGKPARDPKGTYRLVCPACEKPNSLTVTFCTGCGFTLSEFDEQKMPDNIFLELIGGKDIGTTVHFRNENFLVFDDKFGVSDIHLQAIPTRVIDDITALTP